MFINKKSRYLVALFEPGAHQHSEIIFMGENGNRLLAVLILNGILQMYCSASLIQAF